MAHLPLNLKHFKKIAADNKTTVLKSKDGHEIKIAHKALSSKLRERLDALPMASGGEVKKDSWKEGAEQVQKGFNEPSQGMIGKAIIGAAKSVFGSSDEADSENKAKGGVVGYADGGEVEDSNQNIPVNISQPAIPEALASQPTPTPVAQPSENIPPPSPQQTSQPAPQPQASQEAQDPYGIEAQQTALAQGISEKKAGILGEAEAQAQQAKEIINEIKKPLELQQRMAQDSATHLNDLNNERRAVINDYQNGHIDPDRYMNSKGTWGKISTAIGLILGGLGGSDAPRKFLQQQIQNDIEAQKAELGKRENLLSANLKQFGNIRDAIDMTRIMQNDIIANKLKLAAAKTQDPMARAAALKAAGELDIQSAPIVSQLAMKKTLLGEMSGAQSDPNKIAGVINAMRQLNPEMAKNMEERFVPSVGLAQVPVPADVRENIIQKQNLAKMGADLLQWTKKHSGSLDPATVNEGKAKAAELQSMYRNAIKGGVFKAGEQEFIDQIIDSDPTKFFNSIRVVPKLEEVLRNNNQQMNTLKRGYGLPINSIRESAPVIQKKK